jgi:hypothetical protein
MKSLGEILDKFDQYENEADTYGPDPYAEIIEKISLVLSKERPLHGVTASTVAKEILKIQLHTSAGVIPLHRVLTAYDKMIEILRTAQPYYLLAEQDSMFIGILEKCVAARRTEYAREVEDAKQQTQPGSRPSGSDSQGG